MPSPFDFMNPWAAMLSPQAQAQDAPSTSQFPLEMMPSPMNPDYTGPMAEFPKAAPAPSAPPARASIAPQPSHKSPHAPSTDDQMLAKYMEGLDARRGDLEQQRQLALAYANAVPSGMAGANLAPLAGLIDSWTGSKTAANYERPVNAEDRAKQIAGIQSEMRKSRKDITDDEMHYLKMKSDQELKKQMLSQRGSNGNTKEEDNLRKQYMAHPAYKQMAELSKAYAGIEGNPGSTGPEQQALVYQFSRILDPGSVVRETEYAMSAANAGKINQASQYLEKLRSGKSLTPEQIVMMKDVARNLIQSGRGLLNDHNALYSQLAVRKGIDPSLVIIDPFYKGKAPGGGGGDDQARSRYEELRRKAAGGM